MKLISTIALLAGLAVTPTLAQSTSASTGIDAGVGASVEAGGVSVDTSASAGVDASAGGGTDTSSSMGSTDVSSVSSQLSSDASGLSSSQQPSGANGMTADQMCAAITSTNLATTAIDAAALEAVTSVTVLSTSDCSGLTDTVAAGADIQTSLLANAMVMQALQAQGNASAEIVGYVLDGTSLTVFVRNK